MKKQIPNAITCLNLASGVMAIIFASRYNPYNEGSVVNLHMASMMIGVAALFDLLDGMLARILGVYSELGKQLDSLADAVSFGVAPGLIFYYTYKYIPFLSHDAAEQFRPIEKPVITEDHYRELIQESTMGSYSEYLVMALGIIIIVFSIIRLGRFNLDTRQSVGFIGVPTPANAMLIASFPLMMAFHEGWIIDILTNPWFVIVFPLLSAYLMNCELPLLSLKFKNLSFRENFYRWLLLAIGLVLVIFLRFAAVPFIFAAYILISILANYRLKDTYEVHS